MNQEPNSRRAATADVREGISRLKAEEDVNAEEQPAETQDTLPAWLAQRFDPRGADWDGMSDDDRSYWEHQARAVRRAVERGGFKPTAEQPDTQTRDVVVGCRSRSFRHDHAPHDWEPQPGLTVHCPGYPQEG